MITIEPMDRNHEDELFQMMLVFYSSPAVDHPVDEEVLRRTLNDTLDGGYGVYGYQILREEELVGFGFLNSYYSTEIGGLTVQFEDLYISDQARGMGIGTMYFRQLMKDFPKARRFRLEVAPDNVHAIRLYERLGFTELGYKQMIRDVDPQS